MRHLALQSDGQVDQLTGLDAPEIFYKFLEKALASEKRNHGIRTAIVRFRLSIVNENLNTRGNESTSHGEKGLIQIADHGEKGLIQIAHQDENLFDSESSFAVALFAKFLSRISRSEENITRIGELTFLLLAHVKDEAELLRLENRMKEAIAEVDLKQGKCDFSVNIEGFMHQHGEEMLDFLEKAEV